MTARQGYANMDFEWKSMEALAKKDIENGNKKIANSNVREHDGW